MIASACTIVAALGVFTLAATGQTSPVSGSHLPPTAPTSLASQNSMAPPLAARSSGVNTEHRHRARVTYTDGLLQVRADNSSLNQILRDISTETGMKIIGGVADQRVFGSYGPAPAATVLQTLLDGTGTNMLLQESRARVPQQLVLSPRTGGAPPPGPGSPSYDITESEPELPLPGATQPSPAAQPSNPAQPANPVPAGAASNSGMYPPNTTPPPSTSPTMPQPANNVFGNPNNVSPTASTLPVTNSVPMSTLPTPSTAPPVSGIVSAPSPPPAGSTTAGFANQTPPSGNPNTAPTATAQPNQPATGTKTPQQIYEELKQLQQQRTNPQSSPQANPQGSSAPQ